MCRRTSYARTLWEATRCFSLTLAARLRPAGLALLNRGVDSGASCMAAQELPQRRCRAMAHLWWQTSRVDGAFTRMLLQDQPNAGSTHCN